jgi:hypothetical protein
MLATFILLLLLEEDDPEEDDPVEGGIARGAGAGASFTIQPLPPQIVQNIKAVPVPSQ